MVGLIGSWFCQNEYFRKEWNKYCFITKSVLQTQQFHVLILRQYWEMVLLGTDPFLFSFVHLRLYSFRNSEAVS